VAALEAGAKNDGMRRNALYLDSLVDYGDVPPATRSILCDPQTSGGLLLAAPPARAAQYLSRVENSVEIGEVTERRDVAIVVA
jgi:selenide,water dikinase